MENKTFLEEGIYPNYIGGKFPVKLYVKNAVDNEVEKTFYRTHVR